MKFNHSKQNDWVKSVKWSDHHDWTSLGSLLVPSTGYDFPPLLRDTGAASGQ